MGLLEPGATAPDISARRPDGTTVRLDDLRGRWVVVYFYPKDRSFNCTREACGFRDHYAELRKANVEVIGVSRDSEESHEDFARRKGLPFPLAADPHHEVLDAYGTRAWHGAARRTTFLIGPDGVVAKVYPRVRAAHHARQILRDLRRLREENDKPVLERTA